MIIDGKKIADAILEGVASDVSYMEVPPTLAVLTSSPNFATQKFLNIKKRAAERVGVMLSLTEFDAAVTTEKVIDAVRVATQNSDGIIIQLPFPDTVDIERVLQMLPSSHDVDAIGSKAGKKLAAGHTNVLPPVVGAIAEIVTRERIDLKSKRVVVVGRGRLVGKPAEMWFQNQGANVSIIDRNTEHKESLIKQADVLVLGAGVPNMITPEMIKEGVVIFDAGTSEDAGELRGDADPACAQIASLCTPVPGGIGPITVAVIFKNLLALTEEGSAD